MTATVLEPRITKLVKKDSTIWPNYPNDWAVFWVLTCAVQLTVCSCHVTYAFHSESTLCSCLHVKELYAWSRRNIWNFSECIWSLTQNHFALKRTINHLVKLAKWLSCVLSTYLYGVFDCMFLWCQVRVSEWIHLVVLPEYQETPCTKQAARNLKFKWMQLNSNPESLSSLITKLRLQAKLCYFPISTSA